MRNPCNFFRHQCVQPKRCFILQDLYVFLNFLLLEKNFTYYFTLWQVSFERRLSVKYYSFYIYFLWFLKIKYKHNINNSGRCWCTHTHSPSEIYGMVCTTEKYVCTYRVIPKQRVFCIILFKTIFAKWIIRFRKTLYNVVFGITIYTRKV